MAPLHRIFLLLVPVRATNRSSGVSFPFALAQFVHWAIVVNGICYEVTGEKRGKGEKTYGVKRSAYEEWQRRPGRRGNTIRHRIVGMTDYTASELWTEANHIWKTRFNNTYKINTQNCQNFAYLLYKKIRVDEYDSRITKSTRQSFKPFPRRLTRFKDLTLRGAFHAVAFSAISNSDAWLLYALVAALPTIFLRCKDKEWLKQEEEADHAWLEKVYQGYNMHMVDDIADWGFKVEDVVAALRNFGYRKNGGRYLYLNEEDWEELDDTLQVEAESRAQYQGFDKGLVDELADEGFTVGEVVATLRDHGYRRRDNDLNDEEFDDLVDAMKDKAHSASRNHSHMRVMGDGGFPRLQIEY